MIYLCYELMIKQERDPIERVRKLILAHDFATPQELKVLFGLLRLQNNTKCFLSGHRKRNVSQKHMALNILYMADRRQFELCMKFIKTTYFFY